MQIKITDIIPFMKPGWVAMDECGEWDWFDKKPTMEKDFLQWVPDYNGIYYCINNAFDIAPADDWTQSLIQVKGVK